MLQHFIRPAGGMQASSCKIGTYHSLIAMHRLHLGIRDVTLIFNVKYISLPCF